MPTRNRAFQTALRFLLASSAMLLLLMAALQFLPGWRIKISAFPTGFAGQQQSDRAPMPPVKRMNADPVDDDEISAEFTPSALSGSVAGEEIPDVLAFPEPPPAHQATTIEIAAADPFAAEDETSPDVPPPPVSTESGDSLSNLEKRLSELAAQQAEQNASRDAEILEALKSHSAELKAVLERIESTERQVLNLKESDLAAETNATPPSIQIESVLKDGEQRLVIEARDASLPNLLARLGEAAGINLLVSPDVTGTVSLHLSLADSQDALKAVCRIHNCRLEQNGPLTVISQTAPGEHRAAKPVIEHVTKLYHLEHLSGSEIRPYVAAILTPETGTVTFASIRERVARTVYRDPPRAILVKDAPEVIAEVDRLILELDRPPKNGLALPKRGPFAKPEAGPARTQPRPAEPARPAPQATGPSLPMSFPAGPSCTAPSVENEIFLPPIER